MLISLILAWLAVLFSLLSALKWVARVSGNRALNRFFRKVHIPFGVLLVVTGGLHGLLAGNAPGAALSDIQLAPVLLTLNWGTGCLVLAIFLGITYLLRRELGRKWMTLHRIATVALLLVLGVHLLDVGIQLPARLMSGTGTVVQEEIASGSAAESDTSSADTGSTSENQAAGSGAASAGEAAAGAVTFSGAVLKDGVYEGSADGYRGSITVSVSVEGGVVTGIEVLSESDTEQFFSRAQSVLTDITDQQSLEVDTVTGATFSSAGLLKAVYNALQGAVSSGELRVTEIDLSAVTRHGGK